MVTVREEGKEPRPLAPRFDLRNHSPTGFEWGYGGSGPAQLGLALAADVLGDDERAQDVYQDLKWEVLSGIDADSWMLTEQQLRDMIQTLEKGAPSEQARVSDLQGQGKAPERGGRSA